MKNIFKEISYVFTGIFIFAFIMFLPISLYIYMCRKSGRKQMEEDYYQYTKYDDIRKQYNEGKKNEN